MLVATSIATLGTTGVLESSSMLNLLKLVEGHLEVLQLRLCWVVLGTLRLVRRNLFLGLLVTWWLRR